MLNDYDRNPDHWKLYFIYFNPDDPRLIVRKRIGFGHTVNCARPIVWVAVSVFVLAAVAIGSAAH